MISGSGESLHGMFYSVLKYLSSTNLKLYKMESLKIVLL